MSDIVERLRGLVGEFIGYKEADINEYLIEAADEIERLRAVLQKIAAMDEVSVTDFDGEDGWTHQCVARAALAKGLHDDTENM